MNKNKLLIVIPLLFGGLITSCNSGTSETGKVNTLYGSVGASECKEIHYEDYASLMKSKNSFVVAQYPDSSCVCWSTFERSVLNTYIKDTNILIYKINYKEFYNGNEKLNTYGMELSSDSPGFHIVLNGSIKYHEMYDSKNKIFTQIDSFKVWVENFITAPSLFYVTLTDLEKLYKGTTKFAIYYSWSVCNDCKYLQANALNAYAQKHLDNNLKKWYIIDCYCEGIMLKNGNYDDAQYREFTAKYGLSVSENYNWGYLNGKVPTLQYVEPNGTFNPQTSVKQALVYVNDVIDKNENGYYVKDSFFTNERSQFIEYAKEGTNKVIKGKTLDEKEVTVSNESYSWNHEDAAKSYDPLFSDFMDYINIKL